MNQLASALDAWIAILGAEHVLTESSILCAAQTATFATSQHILAILRPANREQVQACVRVANTFRTPLYPISTGKNWGYGSRVPVRDGSVILDLGRLNRILEYDEKLAYVTVEPGVTFRQLATFLREQQSALTMSITGSTPDSSLVGNLLERGVGTGPYGDRAGHACSLEVVLPTGECIHTGFDRFAGAQAAHVSRWGVGPSLDGLFSQSNLGIVTRLTLWLTPKPAHAQICFFAIQSAPQLEALVDVLRKLKLDGVCVAPIRLYNDYKILSSAVQYPWRGNEQHGFFTLAQMVGVHKAFGIGVWNGVITITAASKKHGEVLRELIQEAIQPVVDQLIIADESQTQSLSTISETFIDIMGFFRTRGHIETINSEGSLRGVYWKKKTPVPEEMDPDRDRCGLIWCTPSVPFDGRHVRAALDIIEQCSLAAQIEPNISLLCISERNVIVNAVLVYDREVPGEDERAAACYKQMLAQLAEVGYFPYRLSIQSMDALPVPDDAYGLVIQALKHSLDPNDILAPGRYDFRSSWPLDQRA